MIKSFINQKQNRSFLAEPRNSLKMNLTNKKKSQKSDGRMSMLPLKRQRISVGLENQFAQACNSLRTSTNLLNSAITNSTPLHSAQRSIRKETIINNLVNKLDEESQIRSIIQTKLRRNSYGPNKQFMYTSEFQPYSANTSFQKNHTQQFSRLMEQANNETYEQEQCNATVLSTKLRQCQDELDYFKSIVNEMSKKIKFLQKNQTTNSKAITLISNQKANFPVSNHCCNCLHGKCFEQSKFPQEKQPIIHKVHASSQTIFQSAQNIPSYRAQQTQNYEFDFFDNLDRTIKILNKSKNL